MNDSWPLVISQNIWPQNTALRMTKAKTKKKKKCEKIAADDVLVAFVVMINSLDWPQEQYRPIYGIQNATNAPLAAAACALRGVPSPA